MLARRLAVQAIYQWHIVPSDSNLLVREFLAERKVGQLDEIYFAALVKNIVANYESIKSNLEEFLDRDWEQIEVVEKSILLIGASEVLSEEIPTKVAINESIELCKIFGTVEGFKFVNGVLDSLSNQVKSTALFENFSSLKL